MSCNVIKGVLVGGNGVGSNSLVISSFLEVDTLSGGVSVGKLSDEGV